MSWEEWLEVLLEYAARRLNAPGVELVEIGSEAEYRRCFEQGLTPERAFEESRSFWEDGRP